jgi:hypothetical protein
MKCLKCEKEIETIRTLMLSSSYRWDNIFRCDPILNKLYSKRKKMTEQVKYMYIWYGHIRTKIIVLFFNLELMITILEEGKRNRDDQDVNVEFIL